MWNRYIWHKYIPNFIKIRRYNIVIKYIKTGNSSEKVRLGWVRLFVGMCSMPCATGS
jgi:hypothetical protein